jgi:hypothetical protein
MCMHGKIHLDQLRLQRSLLRLQRARFH